MRTLRFIMTIFILLVCSGPAFANGGPIAWTDTTPMGGGAALKDDTAISLEYESLHIRLHDDLNTYSVEAKYHLKNDGKAKAVQFGVPLTWPVDMEMLQAQIHSDDEASREADKARQKELKLVSGKITLELDGKKVPCSPVRDKTSDKSFDARMKAMQSQSSQSYMLEAWCVADLKMAGGSRSTLTMKYDGELNYEDWVFSKSALTEFSDRRLSYLFYPAGFWHGNVGTVDVVLDLGPYRDHVESTAPDYTSKKGPTLEWHLKNVDFKKLRSLEVVLSPELMEKKQLLTWNKSAGQYQKVDFKVTASSSLPNNKKITYSPENVTDGSGKTAWCEGAEGDGVGEWLEFHVSKNTNWSCGLEGIVIVPGYVKSQKSYLGNGRVRKVKISDCREGSPYVFDVPLSDNSLLAPYLFNHGKAKEPWDPSFIKEDGCFRLEIVEVEKGRFDDTCISEVSLVLNCG